MEQPEGNQTGSQPQLLQLATLLWKEGLCFHCLGRMVARLGYGLANYQRGQGLMVTLSMLQEGSPEELAGKGSLDLPYVHGISLDESERMRTFRTTECNLCEGLFSQIRPYAEQALSQLQEYQADTFAVGSMVEQELVTRQEALIEKYALEHSEPLKQHLNRELSREIQQLSSMEAQPEEPELSLLFDTRYDVVKVTPTSLFIEGRYRKLVRDLPQTHWPCRDCRGLGCQACQGTGYRYPSSVEQLVAGPLQEAAQAQEERFHGAGREDIDVRCLGTGRPFIVELRQPRLRDLDLEELTQVINEQAQDKVEVSSLVWTTRKRVPQLKNDPYDKTYRVAVAFEEPVAEESLKKALGLLASQVIHQQTPSRVAHRRADRIRQRHLRSFEIREHNEKDCSLEFTCEHGTYVKELVHGDEGRTDPNLAALLATPCQVTALDVTAVHDK